MAPHESRAVILYGVRAIAPPPLRVRVPHRQQSTDVRRLLGDLSARVLARKPETALYCSLSHSRGVVAAVVAGNGRVGIDVEYMCPRREMHRILEVFLGPMDQPVSLEAFYRAWTFGEAYFKAFGELPSAESLQRVVEHHADVGLQRLDRLESVPIGVLNFKPFNDFVLTIVWEMADITNAPNQPPARLLYDERDGT